MATREELIARRAQYVTALEAARVTYLELVSKGNQKARLDTGQGSQMFERLTPTELQKQITFLEQQIDKIDNQLNACNGGLMGLA
jgi:hypothetical protein